MSSPSNTPWTTDLAAVLTHLRSDDSWFAKRMEFATCEDALEIRDLYDAVLLRAVPDPATGVWHTSAWALPTQADEDTTRLTLAVLAANPGTPTVTLTITGPSPFPAGLAGLFDDWPDEVADFAADAAANVATELRHVIIEARKTIDFATVLRRFPSLQIVSAGGACPFQSEGTLQGHPYYFRYRHGYASLSVGGEDCVGSPLWHAGEELTDQDDGWLSFEEFTNVFTRLASRLERAPFRYEFAELDEAGQPLFHTNPNGTFPRTWPGWGHTPEEAYEAAATRWHPEVHLWQHYEQEAAALSDSPVEADTRVFPEVDPDFRPVTD